MNRSDAMDAGQLAFERACDILNAHERAEFLALAILCLDQASVGRGDDAALLRAKCEALLDSWCAE